MSQETQLPQSPNLLAGFKEWYRTKCPVRGATAELAAKAAFRHLNAKPASSHVVLLPERRSVRAEGSLHYNAAIAGVERLAGLAISEDVLRRITQVCEFPGHYRDQLDAIEELRAELEHYDKHGHKTGHGNGGEGQANAD